MIFVSPQLKQRSWMKPFFRSLHFKRRLIFSSSTFLYLDSLLYLLQLSSKIRMKIFCLYKPVWKV